MKLHMGKIFVAECVTTEIHIGNNAEDDYVLSNNAILLRPLKGYSITKPKVDLEFHQYLFSSPSIRHTSPAGLATHLVLHFHLLGAVFTFDINSLSLNKNFLSL